MFKRLWRDESGAVVSAELVLLMTVFVIGLTVGAVAVQNAINDDLADVAAAIRSFDQSFAYCGTQLYSGEGEMCAVVAGSAFVEPGTADPYLERVDLFEPGISVLGGCQ